MKIGIVNDLPLAAEALRRAVGTKPDYEVIWIARDGAEAVAACANRLPDLVLMDLVMPVMDGVEATRRIMASTPCAILVVTASIGANTSRVFEAMGNGALDAIDTPTVATGQRNDGAAPLLAKIDSISKLIAFKAADTQVLRGNTATVSVLAPERLVAIGSSAGGPAALMSILSALPENFPAAITVVQHVDAQFARGLADWLNAESRLRVRIAEKGDRPEVGTVLVAGSNDHLVMVSGGRLAYTPTPSDYVYRPSVDVLFHSVCRHWSFEAVGVLLTGMGSDGAVGLKALRNKGHHTIAQDQASSAVYGMPKAAAKIDAATDILSLDRVAARLVTLFAVAA
jgi:two-component system, chemotaxis family, response regulator WspF